MTMVAVRPKFGALDWDTPSGDDFSGTPLRVQRMLRACMYERPAAMELKWNAVKREWHDVSDDKTGFDADDDDDAMDVAVDGDAPPPATPVQALAPYEFGVESDKFRKAEGTVPVYAKSEEAALHGVADGIKSAAARFKETDGVTFSSDFRFCKHAHVTDRRLFVLSESWAAASDPSPWMTWRVQPLVAGYRYGDVYVGLTEASVSYQYAGAVRAVDCECNVMRGPWFDVVRHDGEPVHRSGADRRADFFVVAVDLYKQQGAVSCYEARHAHNASLDGIAARWTQHFDLDGWRSARLCVSMHTMGDSIELVACDGAAQPDLPLKEAHRGITPLG